ncbi:hypothetical protein GF377_01645 [candidate division GN15 bacterium]|nr:hypothetical protein [candidate division GN15 bacterium]
MSKKRRANAFLTLGVMCMVCFIVLGRFAGDANWAAFLTGMFVGLSITFNTAGLVLWRRLRPRSS